MPKGIKGFQKGHPNYITDEVKKKLKGRIAWNRGKKLGPNPEHSKRMKGRIPWNKGKKFTEEHKRKISIAHRGKKISKEHRKKMSKAHKGKKHSEETKKKISEAHKRNPGRGMLGKHHSEEVRKRISLAQKGKKSINWQGGLSFKPYTTDWTNDLKRAIRKRDRYTCGICGKEPAIIIHHIDYNKLNCNPNNLITLCRECHGKTNHSRNYWIDYFKKYE